MNNIILVAIGGALGSTLRYIISEIMAHYTKDHYFPFATITVNIIGSLLMGILYFLISKNVEIISPQIRLLLMVGFLGGFTTFSAFSSDTLRLIHNGQTEVAFIYITLSIIFSIIAIFSGFYLAKILF